MTAAPASAREKISICGVVRALWSRLHVVLYAEQVLLRDVEAGGPRQRSMLDWSKGNGNAGASDMPRDNSHSEPHPFRETFEGSLSVAWRGVRSNLQKLKVSGFPPIP